MVNSNISKTTNHLLSYERAQIATAMNILFLSMSRVARVCEKATTGLHF